MGARRRCCCATGCVYFTASFVGTDTTNLGSDWTEVVGDWFRDGEKLLISATPNAEIACTKLHPTGGTKYLVSVAVTIRTNGDVARVKINGGAQFAEIERVTATCGRLRIYSTNTGTAGTADDGYYGSVGISFNAETANLVVCSDGDKVHVGTGGSPLLTVPATVTSSEILFGTGACTGDVLFDEIVFSKHHDDDATCPACGNQGCTWFSDYGCASGSLSPTDWTTTGTWSYFSDYWVGPCIRCTADGTLSFAPQEPVGTAYGLIQYRWM